MPRRYCYRCAAEGREALVDPGHKHRNREKERARRADPNQRAYRGIGPDGRAWRRERAAFLRRNPLCQHDDGCVEPAAHVHHKDGLGPTGPLGLDHSNFVGLCPSHHGQVEDAKRRRDDAGKWV
jgi:hypothetical protein